MITFSGKLYDALELAAKAHGDQKRKGSDIPYITHPVAAAMLLLKHGFAEEMIITALLHDTVEDTAVTLEDIRRQFGEKVAELVARCSEADRSAPWEERKSATLKHLAAAPADAAAVICADKLHNIISIARDYRLHGEAVWARFNRGRQKVAWYYRGLAGALAQSLGEDSALYREFQREGEGLFGEEGEGEESVDDINREDQYRNIKPVKLSALVEGMEMQFESFKEFLNLETGEVVSISIEALGAAEEEEELPEDCDELDDDDEMQLARDILDNYENYEELPDKDEIDDYAIMESFCESRTDQRLRGILCEAISGRGAFRRFREKVDALGIAEDWYSYRADALKEIAVDWCERNCIRYMG